MTPLGLAIKGTAVLLAAALAARALRRAPAAWRHAAWTAAFASLVALPVLAALGPTWRMAVLPAAPAASGPEASGPPVGAGVLLMWGVGVWALGALAVAARWAVAHVAARRLVRRAVPVGGARWRRAEAHARDAVGLRLPVRLLRSARLDTPAAWGIRPSRRTVLLPRSAQAWSCPRRRAVLLHEMAHLRRGDLLTQLVAQAAVAVHWFNPLVWRAYRAALVERELACDDAALRAGADAADYAGHLLALARTLRPPHAALAAMAGRTALETRIVAILTPDHARGPASRASLLTTAALAAAVAVAVAGVELVPTAAAPLAAVPPTAADAGDRADAAPAPAVRPAAPLAAVLTAPIPLATAHTPSTAETPAAGTLPPEPNASPTVPLAPIRLPARTPAPLPAPVRTPEPYVPLAFKSVDPDEIVRQVAQLRATVAALHDLDPAALSHAAVDEALAAVPDLTAADRAALHADALADLSAATAAAERRLWEAETAFERDVRGGRGARGPSI